MKPSPFRYHRPATTDEAVQMLEELNEDESGVKVLAGGQSLVPLMSMRLAAPGHLVDITHLPGLATVEVSDTEVRVGALARHRQVELDEPAYAALPAAAPGTAERRPSDDPQPGYDGGQHRARRPGRGDDRRAGPARRQRRAGRPRWASLRGGGRLLRRADDDRRQPVMRSLSRSASRGPRHAAGRRSSSSPAGTATTPCAGWRPWSPSTRTSGSAAARLGLISVGGRTGRRRPPGGPHRDRRASTSRALRELVDAAIEPVADIHATAEYRRHLALVLSARAVEQARADASERLGGTTSAAAEGAA